MHITLTLSPKKTVHLFLSRSDQKHVRTQKQESVTAQVVASVLPHACSYLESFDLVFESVVLRLQVLRSMLGLAQLCFQLSLQLPAALLKLQQLLLSLTAAAGREKRRHQTAGPDRNRSLCTPGG